MIAPLRDARQAHVASTLGIVATALALALGTPALSVAQTGAASDVTPATRSAASPAPDAPASPTPATAAPATAGPAGTVEIVAVLPLGSPSFGRAAEAVQAGFLAAAEVAKARPTIVAHGDGDVLAAFERAKKSGAHVIVGPLTRDDVKAIAGAGLDLPPTIALNQLDDGAALPPWMYALSLTVDSDARQLARRAREDGATSVAVVAAGTPLQQRFAAAFNAEWLLAGGGPPTMFRFERSPEALAQLRRELGSAPFDAVLLAIDGADAPLVKSYVKALPTYASSLVNDRQPREVLRDLDDLRFVDIPWVVDRDAGALSGVKRLDYASVALERLYALGVDAFRVAQQLAEGPRGKLDLDGATGHLSLDASRHFVREGRMMVFRSGEIVPADTR